MSEASNWRSSSSADLEAKATRLLDRIPGYRGYRDKEGRRDADRLVRESVSSAYDRLASRAESVGRSLADQRRIADVGPVTDLTDRIRHLANRIRTASYGYSPLFSDRVIDETALDQLRRFDDGLMSGVTDLEKPMADLEAAAASNESLQAAIQSANAVVRTNIDRLELRGKVIESGRPEPESSVVAVLGPPTPPPPHPAFFLNQGDAISVMGDDHIVDARIDIDAGEHSARFFVCNLDHQRGGSSRPVMRRSDLQPPRKLIVAQSSPAQPPRSSLAAPVKSRVKLTPRVAGRSRCASPKDRIMEGSPRSNWSGARNGSGSTLHRWTATTSRSLAHLVRIDAGHCPGGNAEMAEKS